MPISVLSIYFVAVSTGYQNPVDTAKADNVEDRGCSGLVGLGKLCNSPRRAFPEACCPSGATCTWEGWGRSSQAKCRLKIRSCSCVNTRDNRGGNTCVSQLNYGLSCKNFLGWKDCDRQCNLCACSTASGITQEHCNGRGTCEATCTQYTCTGAKCKCDPGWS